MNLIKELKKLKEEKDVQPSKTLKAKRISTKTKENKKTRIRVNALCKHKRGCDRVVIYHKPSNEMVTKSDPSGRKTVYDRLPPVMKEEFITVGRLDYNTSGLLIFTNSGEFANNLAHPRYQIEREYLLRIYGEPFDETQINQLRTGILLSDGLAKFNEIHYQSGINDTAKNHWYRVIITEGRNREIRRMCEKLGVQVSRLVRTRFDNILLPRWLHRGNYFELENGNSIISELKERLNDA